MKCATVVPDKDRVEEFYLDDMYDNPNMTIRKTLGGTQFREPILIENVPKIIPFWKKPVIIASPSFGEKKQAIKEFATLTFSEALNRSYNLYLSTQNSILKQFDADFKEIFDEVYIAKFKSKFEKTGITYEHKAIDDMVSFTLRSPGGYIWACKSYDGEVQSKYLAQGFGSLGLMTSVIETVGGCTLCETVHGTVSKHFKQYQSLKETSTNSIASIFAWTKGLYARAKIDQNEDLMDFADTLEKVTIETVMSQYMTNDLATLVNDQHHNEAFAELDDRIEPMSTQDFIN